LNEKVESGQHNAETPMRKLEAENAELKQRLEALEEICSSSNQNENAPQMNEQSADASTGGLKFRIIPPRCPCRNLPRRCFSCLQVRCDTGKPGRSWPFTWASWHSRSSGFIPAIVQ
jgi:phage host-nuclease inhibitor protein Gam